VAGWFGGGAKDPVSQAHRDVVPGLIRQTLAADFAAGRRNPSVYSRALNFMRSLTPAGAVVTQLMDRVPPVPYPDVRAEVWRALSDGKVRRGMRSTDVVGSPWLRAWADAFGPAVGPSRSSR
jgi:hypothetical protein